MSGHLHESSLTFLNNVTSYTLLSYSLKKGRKREAGEGTALYSCYNASDNTHTNHSMTFNMTINNLLMSFNIITINKMECKRSTGLEVFLFQGRNSNSFVNMPNTQTFQMFLRMCGHVRGCCKTLAR